MSKRDGSFNDFTFPVEKFFFPCNNFNAYNFMGGMFQGQNAHLEKMFDAGMMTNLNYTMSFQQSTVKHNANIKSLCACKRINIQAGIRETTFHIRGSDEYGPGGSVISSKTN